MNDKNLLSAVPKLKRIKNPDGGETLKNGLTVLAYWKYVAQLPEEIMRVPIPGIKSIIANAEYEAGFLSVEQANIIITKIRKRYRVIERVYHNDKMVENLDKLSDEMEKAINGS